MNLWTAEEVGKEQQSERQWQEKHLQKASWLQALGPVVAVMMASSE